MKKYKTLLLTTGKLYRLLSITTLIEE